MPTLVSVIIPTLNRAHLLAQAIQSVLDQRLTDFELIIVDDGSTDDTPTGVNAYNDPRIRYIRQANAGVSAARNRGIQEASGRYIAFLDDDDLFLPTKLEKQVAYLEAHPEMAMVHSRYVILDAKNNLIETIPSQGAGQLYLPFLKSCTVALPTVMLRREIFDAVGLFDQSMTIGEDIHLWIRIAKHYPIGEIQEPLVKIRQPDIRARRDTIKILHAFLKIISENRAASPQIGPLFWRRLIAYQHNLYGHQLLTTQPEQMALAWRWLLTGMVQWPFSPRGWLLGLRLIFRTLVPLRAQSLLRKRIPHFLR